jgi:transposase
MNEILNIEFHTIRLVVKSLNCTKNSKEAAEKLGISKKTLYNYMRQYDIIYDLEKNIYIYDRA